MYIALLIIIVLAVLFVINSIVKSSKDPDVINASNLKMSVIRYRMYKEWFDKHQELMDKHGTNSEEANKYFESFFDKIPNMNEWRRYQNFRMNEVHNKFRDSINSLEK